MKKLLFFLPLTFSLLATAGDKVGNGGDVIVCPDNKTILLDIYQGSEDWGFSALPRKGMRSEIITDTLKSFSRVDPYIFRKILKRALELDKELFLLEQNTGYRSSILKLTKNELVNISDEGVAELPTHCKIVQAATQIQRPFPGEVKFTFQESIWLNLETDVQASLILHEVIYEHMIGTGEFSSRSTRYFTAALHSGYLDTVKNYFDVSSFFSFRNLDIAADGIVRYFGTKKNCELRRQKFKPGNSDLREGTTIIVGSRNIVTKEEDFSEALELFWRNYVAAGECD